MIARIWTAYTTDSPTPYRKHFREVVVPNLERIKGFRQCSLLEHADGDRTDFVALTWWDTIEDIRAFAGDDLTRAHVEPEGRAALTGYDEFATNYTESVAGGEGREPRPSPGTSSVE